MDWLIRILLMTVSAIIPAVAHSQALPKKVNASPAKKKAIPTASAAAPIDLILTDDYMTTAIAQKYRPKKLDLAERARKMYRLPNDTAEYAGMYLAFQEDLQERRQSAYWDKLPEILVGSPPAPTDEAYYAHRKESRRKEAATDAADKVARLERKIQVLEEAQPEPARARKLPSNYYHPKNRFGPSLYDNVQAEGSIDAYYNAADEHNNRVIDYYQMRDQE